MFMKKNILYALALATTMVACTDDYTDWAAPQENGPEEAKSVSVSVSPASAIDFASNTSENVAIFSASVTAEEGATATYKVTLSPEDNSASTVLNSANGSVPAEELKNAVVSFYGKAPTPRILKAVVDAYVDIKGQTVKVTAPAVNVNVTLDAPQISEKYYIIGEPSAWDPTCTTMPFNHSSANVYDDPIFTILIPAEDKDGDGYMWFAVTDDITIEENSWDYVFGCTEGNGNNAEKGGIARRLDLTDEGSFKVAIDGEAKFFKVTLNMMDYAYTIEKLNFAEFIYVPGNHQGWAPDKAPALQSPNFDGVYVGYTYLNGNFKFTKERNWNAEYNFNDFAVKDDIFFNNDGSNINISEEGFYQIKADVASSNLSAMKTTWSIIGSATGDPNWGTDLEMTYVAEDESWTYTGALTAGEFKFRANKDWALSFGGASFDDLTSDNGANLKIEEDGNYEVKFFLTRSTSDKIYCTLTKK